MTILPAHVQRDARNLATASLSILAYEFECEVADILALLNQQPASSSQPQAAAASTPAPVDAQAEGEPSSLSATPSPEPQPTKAAVQMQASAEGPQAAEGVVIPASLAGAEGIVDRQSSPATDQSGEASASPAPRERILALIDAHPNWTASEIAAQADVHVSTVREMFRQIAAGNDAPKRLTKAEREAKLLAMFADGNQPTANEAAIALGYTGQGGVRKLATKLGLTFRTVTKNETIKRIQDGMSRSAERSGPWKRKPRKAAEPVQAPTPQPEPEQPPVSTAVALPPVQEDVTDALHVVRRPSTSARFYIRDAKGRYLHQSLEASPTDDGPLMTSNRKWAWFDNAQRLAGATKKWPEISAMRREAPQP
jgi:hypothetical protein